MSGGYTTGLPNFDTGADLSEDNWLSNDGNASNFEFYGSDDNGSWEEESEEESPSPEEIYCQIAASIFKDVVSGGDDVVEIANGSNQSNSTQGVPEPPSCVDSLDNAKIHNFVLLTVACILCVFLTSQMIRKNILPRLFGGRPAMLMPLPVVEPCRLRFTYSAFWGMVAYDAIGIVLDPQSHLIISMACKPTWLKSIIILANVHIYAVIYFPVVGGISTGTTLGGVIATAWTWTLTLVKINRIIVTLQEEEESSKANMAAKFFEFVLPVVFMLYLCVILPFRLVKGLHLNYKTAKSMYAPLAKLRPFMTTPEANYVAELFRKKPFEVPTGIRRLLYRYTYRNRPGFRYSSAILSTLTIGGIFLYYILYLDAYLVSMIYPVMFEVEDEVGEMIVNVTAFVESGHFSGNISHEAFVQNIQTKSRHTVEVAAAYVWALMHSHIFALALVGFLQIALLLTLLPVYRRDMMNAYKGKYKLLIHPSYTAPRSIISGALRYVGFQSVMFAWGLIIQLLVITLLAFLINCIIIIPLRFGFGQWIIDRIVDLLPALAVTIGLLIIQMLVVAFCFTMEPCGRILAVDNARGYSNFVFLSFFKNIFIGIVSALLRLVLAVVFGAFVFSRLDMPTIPPLFRKFDNGFRTYEAFIHLENAHLNPALVTFANIVISGIQRRKEERRGLRNNYMQPSAAPAAEKDDKEEDIPLGSVSNVDAQIENDVEEAMERKSNHRRAKFRWFLAKTLMFNPMIVHTRKELMDERQAKIDAIARRTAEERKAVKLAKRQSQKPGKLRRLLKVGDDSTAKPPEETNV